MYLNDATHVVVPAPTFAARTVGPVGNPTGGPRTVGDVAETGVRRWDLISWPETDPVRQKVRNFM